MDAVGATKARFGGPADGGYVLLDDLDGVTAALSLGVGGDASFDVALAARGLVVHQYDPTVARSPHVADGLRFHAKRVVPVAGADGESLASILAATRAEPPLVLKVDIEHDEWAVLDATSAADLGAFAQIVCEFHGFALARRRAWFVRARRVLAALRRQFAVVHVHGNNYEPLLTVGEVRFPRVLEVTFAHRARYRFVASRSRFPTSLDRPNDPRSPDLDLGSFAN
jgi:hypothetical protein